MKISYCTGKFEHVKYTQKARIKKAQQWAGELDREYEKAKNEIEQFIHNQKAVLEYQRDQVLTEVDSMKEQVKALLGDAS